jgi:zinc metalloprotease ZmpA
MMIKLRQCILCFFTTGLLAIPAGAQSAPPSPAELEALRRLEPQRATQAQNYLLETRSRSGLDERYTFRHTESITDPYGTYHGRFREYFNGVRIMGGNVIVHIDRNGQVAQPTLKLFNNIPVSTTPAISQADAVARARAAFDPGGRMSDLETNDVELLIYVSLMPVDRGAAPSTQAPDLSYRRYDFIPRSFTLAWQICVDSDSQSMYYLIDAQYGRVLKQESPSSSSDAPGTGASFFHGPVKFTHKNVGGGQPFAMVDPLRGGEGGNVFLNANRGTSYKASNFPTYRDDDGAWGNGVRDDGTAITDSPAGQTAAVDAFYAISHAWDLLGAYGRNGFDNSGEPVAVRVHWRQETGKPYNDASWHHSVFQNRRGMFLGDGTKSTSLKTVAHELGHGVWFSRFGFMFSENQIHKGLNEGQADIVGTLTEFFSWKAPGESTQFSRMDGEWRWDSRMIDPEAYAKLLGVPGYRYYTSGLEDKEEHVVGCLLGHMFVFLADGATNDKSSTLSSAYLPHGFSGIGTEAAGFLWYWAMAAYYPEYGDFYDMRDAFQAAATSPFTPPHYKDAVNAAFAGIGIGSMPHTGADGKPPTIHSLEVNVDELNSFALVNASVSDNYLMGRVEVYLDNKLAFTDYKLPYGGPVNLAGLSDGPHSIFIKAYDVLGFETTSKVHGLLLGGPSKQIVKNGGFESKGDWNFSKTNPIASDPQLSFAGNGYLRLPGNSTAWQNMVIPPTATGTALRYRVRYDGHDYDGFQDQKLAVELRDAASNALVRTLATHVEGEETYEDPLTRTYRQMVIPIPEKGAYRLAFRVENGTAHRFKVDNVRVTYTEPVTATVTATVRKEEGSVEFAVSLTGIEQSEVQSVFYYLDDAFEKGGKSLTGGFGGWPSFRALVSTDTMSAKTHAVVAVVRYPNNAIAVKAGTYFTVAKPESRIKNGEFEAKLSHWNVSGPGVTLAAQVFDTPSPCFLGLGCIQMGGTGLAHTSYLQQKFQIAGIPVGGSLHYRLRVRTKDESNSANDTFRVYFIDDDGKKVYPVGATYSNLAKTDGPMDMYGYRAIDVPLPKELLHSGPVWVSFEAKENGSLPTWFYVDNVSLILEELNIKN